MFTKQSLLITNVLDGDRIVFLKYEEPATTSFKGSFLIDEDLY
jgi:hypothetical protein